MSKEYDYFWKFHNKNNMDVHTVKLIEQQAKRIEELEATIKNVCDLITKEGKVSKWKILNWLEKAPKGK